MNFASAENYTTMTFSKVLSANTWSWTQDVYLSFIPDQVILKCVNINNKSTTGPDIMLFQSTLTRPEVMTSVLTTQTYAQVTDHVFKNNDQTINGTHTFTLRTIDGSTALHDDNLLISCSFIFIKYKKL